MWTWDDYPGVGWTIELSGPVSITTTTGTFGDYNFRGLSAGTYMICQSTANPGANAGQTVPFPSTSTVTCPSGLLGYTYTVLEGSQSTAHGFNFANQPPQQ